MLLGASGVGKSTLANALLGREALDTGAVRDRRPQGPPHHVARHLLALPGGGVIIDTPGLRSLGLYEAEAGIALAFPDIEELSDAVPVRQLLPLRRRRLRRSRAAVDDGSLAA